MKDRTINVEDISMCDRRALALAIRAALPFASKDETRQQFASVSIGIRNGLLMVAATDGHRAVVIQAKSANAAIYGFYGEGGLNAARFGTDLGIVLPAKILATALKARRDVEAVFYSHEGVCGSLRIGATLESGDWENFTTIPARFGVSFPPIFKVCTALDPMANRTHIAPEYLESAGALGRAIGAKGGGIEITVSDPNSPVVLSCESEAFRAAIWQMPLQLDKAEGRDPRIAQIIDPGPAHLRAPIAAE